MAYDGSQLAMIVQSIEGSINLYSYKTADDISLVTAANYFADGGERGMNVGDWLLITATAGPFLCYCAAENGEGRTVEVAVLSIDGAGFPTTNPGPGSGIIWNNAGFLCVA